MTQRQRLTRHLSPCRHGLVFMVIGCLVGLQAAVMAMAPAVVGTCSDEPADIIWQRDVGG